MNIRGFGGVAFGKAAEILRQFHKNNSGFDQVGKCESMRLCVLLFSFLEKYKELWQNMLLLYSETTEMENNSSNLTLSIRKNNIVSFYFISILYYTF